MTETNVVNFLTENYKNSTVVSMANKLGIPVSKLQSIVNKLKDEGRLQRKYNKKTRNATIPSAQTPKTTITIDLSTVSSWGVQNGKLYIIP